MNGFWQFNPGEVLISAVGVIAIGIGVSILAGQVWDRLRGRPAAEPDDTLEAILEQKGVIEDWLDGVGGVDVIDASAAVQGLIRLLTKVDLPGASEAYLLAIRAEDGILQAHQTLEDLITALDCVLEETEEPAWTDRRERGGDGVGGAG